MATLLPSTQVLTVLGPIKMEIIEFTGTITDTTGATQTGISTADTFDTLMVTPAQVFIQVDVDGVDGSTSSISGKRITFTNTSQTNITARFIVFGT